MIEGIQELRCACVHLDAEECARIRDGRLDPDDPHYHRRNCECECHAEEQFEPWDDQP